ncbi:hypothetical protein CPC08DRAFT_764864 [Agrocybe pediades]|nr:hypothetical protein CPC08DRAFT_764864 [Agrocybe pediades]
MSSTAGHSTNVYPVIKPAYKYEPPRGQSRPSSIEFSPSSDGGLPLPIEDEKVEFSEEEFPRRPPQPSKNPGRAILHAITSKLWWLEKQTDEPLESYVVLDTEKSQDQYRHGSFSYDVREDERSAAQVPSDGSLDYSHARHDYFPDFVGICEGDRVLVRRVSQGDDGQTLRHGTWEWGHVVCMEIFVNKLMQNELGYFVQHDDRDKSNLLYFHSYGEIIPLLP